MAPSVKAAAKQICHGVKEWLIVSRTPPERVKVTLSTMWWYVWQNFEKVLPLTLNLRSAGNVAWSKYSIRCGVLKHDCSLCSSITNKPWERMGNQIGWNLLYLSYKPKQYASRRRYLSRADFHGGLQFNRHLRAEATNYGSFYL